MEVINRKELVWCVYVLKRNNEPFYVGMSFQVPVHLLAHKKKFGFDFTHEIIFESNYTNVAASKEKHVIMEMEKSGIELLNIVHTKKNVGYTEKMRNILKEISPYLIH